jgi:hypothetical protein
MIRVVLMMFAPLLWALWQSLTETGGGGGQGSGQGAGSGGESGSTGGQGSSGSGGAQGGSGTGGGGSSGDQGGGQDPNADLMARYGFSGDQFNPEVARALIDKLRPFETQAAQLNTQLTEAQQKLQEYEAEGQSELQQATTKIANLEADLAKERQKNRELNVRVLAGTAGIIDTEAAVALLKWDELGEQATEDQITAALTLMAKERPWLTVQQQAQRQQQAGSGGGQQGSGQSATNGGRSSGAGEQAKPKPGKSRILSAIQKAGKTNN